MLDQIAALPLPSAVRERLQIVYDYFTARIDEHNGEYKVPCLSELAGKEFDFSCFSLSSALAELEDLNLLHKKGHQNSIYFIPSVDDIAEKEKKLFNYSKVEVETEDKMMLRTIERLPIVDVRKERLQIVYDYYIEQIDLNGGQYKTPALRTLGKSIFGFSGDTLRKDLDTLVEIGLLRKVGTKRAVYSKPVPDEEVDAEVEEVEMEGEFEQPREVRYRDTGRVDDFKPLATIEIDGWEIVDEQGEKWVRGIELSHHLGYEKVDAVTQIYNRHANFFIEGKDSVSLKLSATDGKTYDTRIFSFTGGLKVCRYSEMPAADEVMQQLIDLAEKVRKGEIISVDSHIAKWQDRLMIGVIEPKLTEMEDEIGLTKRHVNNLETKVDDVTQKVDTLTNDEVNNLIQADVDQYIHIDAYLISYRDSISFGDTIAGLRRKIKGRYHLPLKCKTTEIPSRLLNTVSYDLHRSVLARLDKHPDYFYKLSPVHQNFLIAKGYTQL